MCRLSSAADNKLQYNTAQSRFRCYVKLVARARKKHVQTELEFRTWGGKRHGAGRKQVRARKSQPHRRRASVTARDAILVTVRVADRIARMRTRDAYQAIRRAMVVVLRRSDFRIVHASIQDNHIHLIVEASDASALARGVQAFEISAARQLNAVQPPRNWSRPRRVTIAAAPRPVRRLRRPVRARGVVFPDRYHAEILTGPRRAHHALNYVLNNWRRHREHNASYAANWHVDPYASGVSFEGWTEGRCKPLPDLDPLPVCTPQTWLLREGWKKSGAISAFAVPGPRSA